MLTYEYNNHRAEISFSEKPTPEILGILKLAKWRWNPRDKVWYSARGKSLDLGLIDKYVDKANGVRRPDAPCWKCGNPNGFFRNYGPATPVYCDACEEENRKARDGRWPILSEADYTPAPPSPAPPGRKGRSNER